MLELVLLEVLFTILLELASTFNFMPFLYLPSSLLPSFPLSVPSFLFLSSGLFTMKLYNGGDKHLHTANASFPSSLSSSSSFPYS